MMTLEWFKLEASNGNNSNSYLIPLDVNLQRSRFYLFIFKLRTHGSLDGKKKKNKFNIIVSHANIFF